MPELRKDPVVGRWVIIATERARRPGNFVDSNENSFEKNGQTCPFCHNNDPVVHTVNHDGRTVKVVKSGTPLLQQRDFCSRTGQGLYDVMCDFGTHEVIIETPDHIANMADLDEEQVRMVIEAYVARINDLRQNPNFKFALPYKNYGWVAGSRKIAHSRSQIVATPVNPLHAKEKFSGAKKYFDYRDRCIYCDMLNQELKSRERLIIESDHFVAVTPFAARFLFEILILPKKHHCDFAQGVVGFEKDLAWMLKTLLRRIKVGLDDPAYNYVIHSAPLRREHKGAKWRTIEDDYHWHIEVMPRLTRVAGFEKGTGFYICPVPPENMAEFLRGVNIHG